MTRAGNLPPLELLFEALDTYLDLPNTLNGNPSPQYPGQLGGCSGYLKGLGTLVHSGIARGWQLHAAIPLRLSASAEEFLAVRAFYGL